MLGMCGGELQVYQEKDAEGGAARHEANEEVYQHLIGTLEAPHPAVH